MNINSIDMPGLFQPSICLVLLSILISCSEKPAIEDPPDRSPATEYRITGSLESRTLDFHILVAEDAKIEVIAEGFEWAEGPVWIDEGNFLLFTDIPPNKIWRWSEAEGLSEWLHPAGYTSDIERGGEIGANGLLRDEKGRLVMAQHGDRRMARLVSPVLTDNPDSVFETIASEWEGKRFNSPNDAVYHSNGDLYFTDPPYGLEFRMEDPAKEIDFQGVYRIDSEGAVHLLTDKLSRPNGIAFSPDEKTLYVANSDPEKVIWMAYKLDEKGGIDEGRLFYDAGSLSESGRIGLPDGMKVNKAGFIFATGPGGVLVFNPGGTLLGTIMTGEATANCAFNEDESMLYMTADDYLMRIPLEIPSSS